MLETIPGYIRGRDTCQTLACVTGHIMDNLDRNNRVMAIALNASCEFDAIPRALIIHSIGKLGKTEKQVTGVEDTCMSVSNMFRWKKKFRMFGK